MRTFWELATRPFTRLADRLAFAIFGQRAPGAEPVTWSAGNGSHGGSGGHVPQYVPYSRDWDPKHRVD